MAILGEQCFFPPRLCSDGCLCNVGPAAVAAASKVDGARRETETMKMAGRE